MATIALTSELEVLEKYDNLVTTSLSGESVYIRAKETIQELYKDGTITSSEKATIISNIIGGIVTSITTASMTTALDWARSEKDLALKKLELELQLDILSQDGLLKAAQVEQVHNAIRLAKVESRRMYGTPIFIEDDLASLGDDGKVYTEITLLEAQKEKVTAEITLTEQKTKESYAAVHKIIADTYVNYGSYQYTVDGLGVSGVTQSFSPASHITLSETQKAIATEQAKGYTYNAWANALTGSASMLGTAMASEYAAFEAGQPGDILLDTILDTARNLKAASGTVSTAIPTY